MKKPLGKINFIKSLNLQDNATIADAFKAIDGRFGVIVTVVGEKDRLMGVVSEGDLRRAILSGNSLNTPLEKIMNVSPIIMTIEDLDDEIKCNILISQIRQRYGTEQGQYGTIPVIDKNRSVIGLVMPELLEVRGICDNLPEGVKAGSPQVLVVGGAGYIGSVFVRLLLSKGWRVRVLDNILYKQKSLDDINDKRLSVIRGDVTDINNVVEAIEGIDAVVYLAEIVGDAACAHSPGRALKTNYLSVTTLAHLCAYLHINRFVYASSCSVYGGSKNPNDYLSEESELNPVSYYGRMKIMAEQALLGITNPLFAPTILRLATVFGYSYRPRFDLIINTFAKNAFFKKSIEVFGGDQWRPNVHVTDVANAIVKILEAPIDKISRQIFNVGNGKENYRIKELADLTRDIFPGINVIQSAAARDIRNYRVAFDKIEKIVGYTAEKTVREGLNELKSVFEKGLVKDPDDSVYSNIEAIKKIVKR